MLELIENNLFFLQPKGCKLLKLYLSKMKENKDYELKTILNKIILI